LSSENDDQQIKEIREAGKYLATVSGILQGAYFTAVSVNELKQKLPLYESWFFFLPLVFWMMTLVVSLFLMMPYPQPKRFLEKEKHRRRLFNVSQLLWKISIVTFFVGLLWMAGAVIYYLFFVQLPPPKPPTIVITPCP
jgi:hypothetical protein